MAEERENIKSLENLGGEPIQKGISNDDAINDAIDKDIEISKDTEDAHIKDPRPSDKDLEDAVDRVLGNLEKDTADDHDDVQSESADKKESDDDGVYVIKEVDQVPSSEGSEGPKATEKEEPSKSPAEQDQSLPETSVENQSIEKQITEDSEPQQETQSHEKKDENQNDQTKDKDTSQEQSKNQGQDQKEQSKEITQEQPKESVEITTETIMRNGIPIPKDSALLAPLEIIYNPLQENEVSSDVLVKANLASLPLTLQAHESLPIRVQFLIHSVPLLDNIATQILRIIGVGPYEETLAIITAEEPTPEGLIYKDLVELFEQVKRIFSEEDPFLSFHNIIEDLSDLSTDVVKSLRNLEDQLDSAFRKANLASFLLATLGSIEVGFFYLNESFLDVFCPTYNNGWSKRTQSQYQQQLQLNSSTAITAGKLLKAQAALFLELKTQAYISALESGDRSKKEVLDDIFPDFLKDQLLHRRQTTELTPAEQDFLQRCKSRRETLLSTPDDQDLAEHYEWLIFLKELFNYVSKNIGFLIWGRKGRHQELTTIGFETSGSSTPITSFASLSKEELQQKLEEQRIKEREAKERAERQDREKLPTARQLNRKTQQQKSTTSSSNGAASARQSKATATRNPPRLRHILRRPWTGEEEDALIDALKLIGPQWSKILELHGAGGTKSEALKNRTQVQLKDKARNWKMGYLKNKGEAPDYLSKVTGDLGDDRSTKKRKRDNNNNAQNPAAAQSGAPPSLAANKKARATSKSIPSDSNLPTQELQSSTTETNRVSQQESSVRLEKPDGKEKEQQNESAKEKSQESMPAAKESDGDVSMQ